VTGSSNGQIPCIPRVGHTIKAHGDGWLVFKGSEGWVKTHEVHHPGYRGDPYVERSIGHLALDRVAAHIVSAAYASLFVRTVRA
jgi:hypothetical protein